MKNIFKLIVRYYLKLLTKFVLWRHKPFIIAVAGSTNKTTTKEYILKFLREKFGENEVRGNPKSYNTEIGLPLAILYLDSGDSSALKWFKVLLQATGKALFQAKFPQKLVLELGVENAGDMKYLLSLVSPRVAVVTNIEGNYSDADNLDELFGEYKLLVSGISASGSVILNQDDGRVALLAGETKAQVIRLGFSEGGEAKISNIVTEVEGQKFDFDFQGNHENVQIKKYGRPAVYAWAAAKIVKSIT